MVLIYPFNGLARFLNLTVTRFALTITVPGREEPSDEATASSSRHIIISVYIELRNRRGSNVVLCKELGKWTCRRFIFTSLQVCILPANELECVAKYTFWNSLWRTSEVKGDCYFCSGVFFYLWCQLLFRNMS